MGINIGLSPQRTQKVNPVSNLKTGLVSLQFNIIHYNFFETVDQDSVHGVTPSYWKRLSGIEESKQRRQISI